MNGEHATRLQKFLANEADGRVALDLKDVTLVDGAAVRFLAGAETAGVRIVNCFGYVRSWIAAEEGGNGNTIRANRSRSHELCLRLHGPATFGSGNGEAKSY
jgi:hypothetical protein